MGKRVLRLLTWLAAVLCLSVVLLMVGVRLDNYALRRRAESLMVDIRSLDLRNSTFSDVQRVADRWPSEEEQEGACQRSRCDMQISLQNLAWRYGGFFSNHQRILNLYRRIGGRAAFVRASIRVRDNIVWGKSFRVDVDSTYVDDGEGGRFYYTLIGRFGSGSLSHVSYLHPEYAIGGPGGCTGCIEGRVVYTPFADSSDIQRLSDVNLACLTQFHPCATQGDILPSAWKERTSDQHRDGTNGFPCTPSMIRTLSRESRRVVVGVADPGGIASSKDRVVLKLESELKPGDFQNSIPESEIPASLLHFGNRFILFFKVPQMQDAQSCVAPATLQNLTIVHQGVLEDWSDPPVFADPLNHSISPPHVDIH